MGGLHRWHKLEGWVAYDKLELAMTDFQWQNGFIPPIRILDGHE